MRRVIIAGTREFNDLPLLCSVMDDYRRLAEETGKDADYEIVCGGARGADAMGAWWGKMRGFPIKHFPADWDTYGKSAGYRRNADMARYASERNGMLVAFWDEKSKGTEHMINLAKEQGLEVRIIKYAKEI